MIETDVVVVGGGIAGVSVAAEISEHASVLLLEQEAELGYHTTGRSAAQFQESNGNATVRALTKAARPILEDIGRDGDEPVLSPRQTVWIAGPDEVGQLEEFAAAEATVELITAEQAGLLCPVLRPGSVAAAAVEADAQNIDVDLLFRYYRRRAADRGVRVLRGTRLATGARTEAGWLLRTADGDGVGCQTVVNAAGAWSDVVANSLGVPSCGLRPLRRTALVARPSAGRVQSRWPLVSGTVRQFYFRPEADAVLASLGDETPDQPSDAEPHPWDIGRTIERVNEVTTLGLRSVIATWAGLRTFAPDRMPVVGNDPLTPGFCWLAGQGGYGIQAAPVFARLAAAAVAGRSMPAAIRRTGFDPAELSPARFTWRPGVAPPSGTAGRATGT